MECNLENDIFYALCKGAKFSFKIGWLSQGLNPNTLGFSFYLTWFSKLKKEPKFGKFQKITLNYCPSPRQLQLRARK